MLTSGGRPGPISLRVSVARRSGPAPATRSSRRFRHIRPIRPYFVVMQGHPCSLFNPDQRFQHTLSPGHSDYRRFTRSRDSGADAGNSLVRRWAQKTTDRRHRHGNDLLSLQAFVARERAPCSEREEVADYRVECTATVASGLPA